MEERKTVDVKEPSTVVDKFLEKGVPEEQVDAELVIALWVMVHLFGHGWS